MIAFVIAAICNACAPARELLSITITGDNTMQKATTAAAPTADRSAITMLGGTASAFLAMLTVVATTSTAAVSMMM
ncbi:hypothetical protein AAW01_09190 [Aurantiacibacter gangjinensis]|uniref:Uncharacterized protein n=1 Tax=Aurantiacibacter gangjinensis TaxID=502682 RepID=A0A0G9MM49_9SPHN|nr:hypothetical protein AAW01_09190 [Aurantiacibacter gangjinensis]